MDIMNENEKESKQPFFKPQSEVGELGLEQALLTESGGYDYGNGGKW